MTEPQLYIRNHGPLILESNFWGSTREKAGYIYLSTNAGAFRLLLPASQEGFLDDMRTAKGCAVSRGPWLDSGAGAMPEALEILFDDETTDPFAFHIGPEQFDRVPTAADTAGEWVLSVWTQPRRGRPHKALERPCRYRLSDQLPDLRPWKET